MKGIEEHHWIIESVYSLLLEMGTGEAEEYLKKEKIKHYVLKQKVEAMQKRIKGPKIH